MTVRNASSLPDSAAPEVKRVLETELRPRPRPDGSTVTVTLSERLREFLWVAEIQRGEERDVVMLEVTRFDAPAAQKLAIEKRLLWEQDRPILDVAIAGSLLIVLEPSGVFFYRNRSLVSSLPISSARPIPRDPRGWLEVTNDAFRAFLPGMVCSGVVESLPPSPAPRGPARDLPPDETFSPTPLLPTIRARRCQHCESLRVSTDAPASTTARPKKSPPSPVGEAISRPSTAHAAPAARSSHRSRATPA